MTAKYTAPHPAVESQGFSHSIRPILGETTPGVDTSDRNDRKPTVPLAHEWEGMAWEHFVNELEFE